MSPKNTALEIHAGTKVSAVVVDGKVGTLCMCIREAIVALQDSVPGKEPVTIRLTDDYEHGKSAPGPFPDGQVLLIAAAGKYVWLNTLSASLRIVAEEAIPALNALTREVNATEPVTLKLFDSLEDWLDYSIDNLEYMECLPNEKGI